MKPIEPGCLAVVIAGPFKNLINTVVTVVGSIPDGSIAIDGKPVTARWIIKSDVVDSLLVLHDARTMVAAEKSLRRIDDGDFDPNADGEDNPYLKSIDSKAPHVWAPTRQV